MIKYYIDFKVLIRDLIPYFHVEFWHRGISSFGTEHNMHIYHVYDQCVLQQGKFFHYQLNTR